MAKNLKNSGFTILELIISIAILVFGVVGAFNAFSIINILTSDSMDKITATYLAQEGMEIVRNIRDSDWLNMDHCQYTVGCPTSSYTWVDGLYVANCGSGCQADYTTGAAVTGAYAMTPWSGDYLKEDATGFYNYTDGANTKFKRKIVINYVTDVDGVTDVNMTHMPHVHIIKVTVQVSWQKKADILDSAGISADTCVVGKNCVKTEGTLYDWYNYVNQ